MRDRLLDLLPLLLVGAILLAFYSLRAQGPALSFSGLPTQEPTPAIQPQPRRTPQAITSQQPLPRRTQLAISAQHDPCNPGRPVFLRGMAALKAALGAQMGEPVECERVVDAAGNTQQRTTAGLAYYRSDSNTSCFTTGWDHWALVPELDLVHWTGDMVDPPANPSIVTY
jgi:hypothetical protein